MMDNLSIHVPDSIAAVFDEPGSDPGRSILSAAIVKWYELGRISQGKASELLNISRAEFLDLLASYRVSAWQYTKAELIEERGLD